MTKRKGVLISQTKGKSCAAATKKLKGVFISQTTGKSYEVAKALKAWLRDDMELGAPWMSDDIQMGEDWEQELEKALAEACCGIFCITADNLKEPWITDEARSLKNNKAGLFPYVIDSSVSLDNDLPHPIKNVQGRRSNRKGTEDLVVAVNKALGNSVGDLALRIRFSSTWWKLKNKMDKISPPR
jgi:hypothetical protein